MPSLDAMGAFAAVVRCGGFTAAAKDLGVSKQRISEQIAKLEDELGVRLLERTTRRVRPTEPGEHFHRYCAAIVEQAHEATRALHAGQSEPAGLLRVGSTVTFGEIYLMDVVSDVLRDWPRLRIDIKLLDRPVDLIAEGFDVAFWFERPSDTTFHARRIGPAYTYFVAHPGYVAQQGDVTSIDRLEDMRYIAWPGKAWSPSGRLANVEPVLQVSTANGALRATLRGVGVAELPSILIEEHVRAGDLVLLFDGQPARTTEIHALYPTARYMPPKVRHFLEAVKERVLPMARLSPPPTSPD